MTINSNDSIIDIQDVISDADDYRDSIECKEEEIDDQRAVLQEAIDGESEEAEEAAEAWLDTLLSELSELQDESESIFELEQACEGYSDILINEDYFTQYVEEFAVDCGEVSKGSWLYLYIDWESAAEDMKVDFTVITFEGTDFYVRS